MGYFMVVRKYRGSLAKKAEWLKLQIVSPYWLFRDLIFRCLKRAGRDEKIGYNKSMRAYVQFRMYAGSN